MPTLPYMQFYVSDYLSDTQHLTTEQHGAYMLLIMNYWQTGKPLPNKDNRLAAIARCTLEQWQSIKLEILEFFQIDQDKNILIHKRIEHDLQKFKDKSINASNAGKISASKRYDNENITIAQQPLENCSTESEQSLIYKDKDKNKIKKESSNLSQTYQKNRYLLTTEFGLYQDILKIFNLTVTDLPYTDNRHWSLHRLRGDPEIGWDRCIQAAMNFKADEFWYKQGYDWLFNAGDKLKDRVSQWAAKSAQAEKPKIIRTLN